jgi:putative transposase
MYAVHHSNDNVVLGKNKGRKQDINLGKKTNQKFVQIPFNLFESCLSYKLEKEGLNFITREESYTSKCSSLDLEPIKKNNVYVGKRIKHRLFKTKNNINLNADVNGSLNILRKEIRDDFINKILLNIGRVVSPLKVTPL